MTEQIRKWITTHNMIQTGDLVVVGLSGGEDSVCLLYILKELADELGISLAALHVHHGIRGAEADEDAAFCAKLCEKLGILCRIAYVDVPAVAAAEKQSLEEAARAERYRELESYRQELGAQRIAVAHHRDDNAETVLWNLFRGSGLKGLSGMEAVNGYVIRPLLGTDKADIRQYLKERGIPWRLDGTNESDDYTRNRIRRHILSYAGTEINSRAAEHICQAAAMAGQADAYLRKQAQGWIGKYAGNTPEAGHVTPETEELADRFAGGSSEECSSDHCLSFSVRALQQEEEILQNYILREAVRQYVGLTDVTAKHVEAIKSLFADHHGASAERTVMLGSGLLVRRSYDTLIVQMLHTGEDTGEELPCEVPAAVLADTQGIREIMAVSLSEIPIDIAAEPTEISFQGNVFELKAFSYDKKQKIPSNRYTKWMDYDKIEEPLIFRYRRTGDFFFLADGRRKTVKAYMIDEKIPAAERGRIVTVAQGSHVLWIAGYRLSEGAKITNDTKHVLQITMCGGEENGKHSCIDS